MRYTNTRTPFAKDSDATTRFHHHQARTMSTIRSLLVAAVTVAGLHSPVGTAAAQAPAAPAKRLEFRVNGGAFVPTGDQRNVLKDAQVTAAQLSWLVRPTLALTGTFGWARSRDIASPDAPKLDVFTSDIGVEVRPARRLAERAVTFSPFVGVGAGARSYNYRRLNVDATNNFAAYASAGGEVGIGRVGVRVEGRDYATGFRPLVGAGTSEMRNDVVIMAALRFERR
jgi:hypothetical protein